MEEFDMIYEPLLHYYNHITPSHRGLDIAHCQYQSQSMGNQWGERVRFNIQSMKAQGSWKVLFYTFS